MRMFSGLQGSSREEEMDTSTPTIQSVSAGARESNRERG
jgi:hypothetical protein